MMKQKLFWILSASLFPVIAVFLLFNYCTAIFVKSYYELSMTFHETFKQCPAGIQNDILSLMKESAEHRHGITQVMYALIGFGFIVSVGNGLFMYFALKKIKS